MDSLNTEYRPLCKDANYMTCVNSQTDNTNDQAWYLCCLWELINRIKQNHSMECNTSQEVTLSILDNCSYHGDNRILYDFPCLEQTMTNTYGPLYDSCFANLKRIYAFVNIFDLVVTIIVIVYGTLSNCSLLAVFCKHRSMWQTHRLFLLSTVVADQLMIFLSLPLHAAYISSPSGIWPFNQGVCKFFNGGSSIFLTVVTYMTAAISVQRYQIIVNPFHSHVAIDSPAERRKVVAASLAIWGFAFVYSIPTFVTSRIKEYLNLCFYIDVDVSGVIMWYFMTVSQVVLVFVIPFTIIAVCYTLTVLNIRLSRSLVPMGSRSNMSEVRAREKTGKLFIVIILSFFMCHLPRNVVVTYLSFLPLENYSQRSLFKISIVHSLFLTLQNVNFCMNSSILFAMSSDIREKCLNIFKKTSLEPKTSITSPTESSNLEIKSK